MADTVYLDIYHKSENEIERSNLRIIYRREGYFELYPTPETTSSLYEMLPDINGNVSKTFIEPTDFTIILREIWKDNFDKAIIKNISGGSLLFVDQDRFYPFLCSLLNEVRSSNELWRTMYNTHSF